MSDIIGEIENVTIPIVVEFKQAPPINVDILGAGPAGRSIEFIVQDGTVGVRREGELEYQFLPTRYVHRQSAASNEWHVVHDLGFRPHVSVVDSAGNYILCNINHIDDNSLYVKSVASFSGEAYCS